MILNLFLPYMDSMLEYVFCLWPCDSQIPEGNTLGNVTVVIMSTNSTTTKSNTEIITSTSETKGK